MEVTIFSEFTVFREIEKAQADFHERSEPVLQYVNRGLYPARKKQVQLVRKLCLEVSIHREQRGNFAHRGLARLLHSR